MTTDTDIELHRDDQGRLVLRLNGSEEPIENIQVARCFPWSQPDTYVSLRNSDGAEVLMLEDLSGLPDVARKLLREELNTREFVPQITAIESIDDTLEVMAWQVQTNRGPIELQVKHSEDVYQLDDGQVLIRDHAGGTFVVKDLDTLDAHSRSLIEDHLA